VIETALPKATDADNAKTGASAFWRGAGIVASITE